MDSADRVLQFNGIECRDASAGKLLDSDGAWRYLSRAQLKTLFKMEKQKNTLLVWITCYSAKESQHVVYNLHRFLEPVGYKRILMVGPSCCGIYVLDDIHSAGSKSSHYSALSPPKDRCPP